jgi:glycosyltransferase involved in cell wall biosynthesis
MILLAVHSSAELYGSDRSLLAICEAAVARGHRAVCLLPVEGPLADRLRASEVEVHIEPLAVLRRADAKRPAGWIALAKAIARANRVADDLRVKRSSDCVVLSNTSAVLSGRVIARAINSPHIQMVREIYSSRAERYVFQRLVRGSEVRVFVSQAARDQFPRAQAWAGISTVINSGAELTQSEHSPRSHSSATIRVTCVGRLSAWKGQSILIRALAILNNQGHSVQARLVGGEYGGSTEVTTQLVNLAQRLGIQNIVDFVGEVDDPTPHYQWADVVVAPSERPEPFGKVVIEAMNNSRPIVASDQGGPAEVLADGRGGLLFAPGDDRALAAAILEASTQGSRWLQMSRDAFTKSLDYSAYASGQKVVSLIEHALHAGSDDVYA